MKKHIIYILEKVLYLLTYTLVFALVSSWFTSFYIDPSNFFFYSFVAVVLILILNKTIKPFLVRLTIPVTGLTMGVFYFFNNVIILKLVDFIMGSKIDFRDLFVLFFVSIIMSFLTVLIEFLLIKPFIKEVKKSE